MRISTMMVFNNMLNNLTKTIEHTQEIQEVISTGKKISLLSDDPAGIAQVVNYQSDLTKLGQYKKNITHGNSWLDMSDSMLQDIQNLVGEAKNIAITQSTSTMNSETRAQAAVAAQNLYEQLIGYGNTRLAGRYIFGGSITDSAPFNANGTYNGNGEDIMVEIIEGIQAKINLAGSEFLVTDLDPALSTASATSGSTSSTGLVARNINTISANPSGLSEYKATFVLTNGLTQEVTYTTDSTPTRDELGAGIADAVNNHYTLNQYIRASYDTTTGNISFEAKETGTEGNQYTIDAANTTVFEGTVNTSFAGGSAEVNSGFTFVSGTNSSIVFQENADPPITADIITHGGAVSGKVYTGDQVASFIERAMESQSGNSYTYTVSYDDPANPNQFSITNDATNGGGAGTLTMMWSAGNDIGTALEFGALDVGPIAAGGADVSNNPVQFNILNGVNDEFSVSVDGVVSGVIDMTAVAEVAYTAANLATVMQTQINADVALTAANKSVAVDYGTTINGQFTIRSSSTGTSSTVNLTNGTNDFLNTVGLDRDFEVSGTSPTSLADLNGGAGVTAGNLSITDRFGRSATIAVGASDTVADVIDNINGSVCVFDGTNSDVVFSENGGADITANIITHGGAVSGQAYTGSQIASFIEQAMEAQSGLGYTYTVSYSSVTNKFTIVNDAGNGGGAGTLNMRWSAAAATAEQELGFKNIDSGAFIAGLSDTSDNALNQVVNVTAQLNAAENGINIVDNNNAPTQNLVVADGVTARGLGIVGNKPGTIYGTDLNPAVTNATRISLLKGGAGLTLSDINIFNGLKNEKIDLSRAESITDILTAIDGLGIDVDASINSSKVALDVNANITCTNSAAIVCEVEGGTTSSDLGIQGATDFLKTLAVLKETLEKNDRYGLLNILDQFDLILDKLTEERSGAGVRSIQLDAMNKRIVNTEFEISELKSEIEDADMVEYLTKFAMQQTALQAIMSTAAQSMQISLLNFLR